VDDSKTSTDAKLDEALEETFPASDPAANTVETGIRTGELPPSFDGSVRDNRTRNRFELSVNGETAFLVYERTNQTLTLIHTEVPPAERGHHVGEALVEAALQAARSAGLRVIVLCPFAKAYLRRHRGL
jgi:predicted GNAT family acetyltransferase